MKPLSEGASRERLGALFMHMSILCGLPIFALSFLNRDNPFVLHHAKAAAVNFLLFYTVLFLSFSVTPSLFWLLIPLYLSALVAIWRLTGGHRAGVLGLGPVGEALFFVIQPKSQRRALEHQNHEHKLLH